jgi:hypothetical protein
MAARRQLRMAAGWDHGPVSVRGRMLTEGLPAPSRATLARIFTRHGMVTPQPAKRPRSSWRRFTFAYVHECWQLDATQTALADGTTATVLQRLDDHSRFVASTVDTGETSAAAVAVLRAGIAAHQVLLLLTDNGRDMNPHRQRHTSALAAYATCWASAPSYLPDDVRVMAREEVTAAASLRRLSCSTCVPRRSSRPGAVSIPLPELAACLEEIPADVDVLAYRRGRYCVMSLRSRPPAQTEVAAQRCWLTASWSGVPVSAPRPRPPGGRAQ